MKHFIVFDMDGTLLNTLPDIAAAMNRVLGLYGIAPHPEAAYRAFTGNGARVLTTRALAGRDALFDEVYPAYLREYALHSRVDTQPYDGVAQMLGELQARGIALLIFSNKDDPEVKSVAAHYFPGVTFAAVMGAKPGVPLKPDPVALHAKMAQLGLQRENGIYVGDTQTDMRCARAAGLYAVAALWGFQDEDELKDVGADEYIKEPLEMLRITGERFT